MRRSFSFLAKLSFSLLLLGAVLSCIDFHKLPTYFADANPSMLVLALLLAMLQVPATSLRWHLLLLTVGVRLPRRTTLEVNIISIFAIVLGSMAFVGLWMLGIYPHVDAHILLRMTGFGLLGLMAMILPIGLGGSAAAYGLVLAARTLERP